MGSSKQKQKKAKKAKEAKPETPAVVKEETKAPKVKKEKVVKEKVAKPPKEKKVKAEKVVQPIAEVDPVHAELVRNEIKELIEHTEREFLDLAERLYEVDINGYWKGWDYEDFPDYANKELAIGFRKAYYYVQIWRAVVRCGESLNRDKLIQLGWTKVKDLATVITSENASEWLGNAEKMTAKEVIEAVKIQKDKKETDKAAAGEAPIVRTMSMKLEEGTFTAINEALSEAKMLLNTKSDADALAHICVEWLEAKGVAPVKTPLSKMVSFLEKAYGVRIKHNSSEPDEPNDAFVPAQEKKKDKKLKAVEKPAVEEEPEEIVEEEEKSVKDLLGL